MIGKIIVLCTVTYVNCQFYSAPCFQNQAILAPVPNMPIYANQCPNSVPGPVIANIPYEVPIPAPLPSIVPNFAPVPANKFLSPEAVPNPRGCLEAAVTPCGGIAEFPIGNPFLPIASPVSGLLPFSPLLPPASPSGCKCQYLKKIPIPPPCI